METRDTNFASVCHIVHHMCEVCGSPAQLYKQMLQENVRYTVHP